MQLDAILPLPGGSADAQSCSSPIASAPAMLGKQRGSPRVRKTSITLVGGTLRGSAPSDPAEWTVEMDARSPLSPLPGRNAFSPLDRGDAEEIVFRRWMDGNLSLISFCVALHFHFRV